MIKQQFKLIGYKIKNSASPFVHSKIFAHEKTQNFQSYGIYDISPNKFNSVFLKLNKLTGANITSPFKIQAFENLKFKSAIAQKFGCVNTVKTLPTGELKGFCTDGFGFLKSLQQLNCHFFNNVLILGFGGAGQTVAHCLKNKCQNLFIAVRNLQKIPQKWLNTKTKFVSFDCVNYAHKLTNLNFQLVVNATTCGNWNSPLDAAINLKALGKIDAVVDLIYYPTETKLLKQANELGCQTLNGVPMLVWQAVAAQKIWNNFKISNNFTVKLIKQTTMFLEGKY